MSRQAPAASWKRVGTDVISSRRRPPGRTVLRDRGVSSSVAGSDRPVGGLSAKRMVVCGVGVSSGGLGRRDVGAGAGGGGAGSAGGGLVGVGGVGGAGGIGVGNVGRVGGVRGPT